MRYMISLFSSEKSPVSATGAWQVSADNAAQAVNMARFYADPQYWPPGSTWVCVPLDGDAQKAESGVWNPA